MNKKLKRTLLVTALGTLCALQAFAGPLEPELRNVLDTHPGIKAARFGLGASQDRQAASMSGYFPKLTVSRDAGKEKVSSATESDLHRHKLIVSLEQSLYNGGRRESGVEIARLEAAIQSMNMEAQIQEVLLEAMSAYLQVARYQTLIGLSKLNEETTLRQLDLERKRVDGGGGISVDVLQARSRLQIVRERRVFYEQGLRDAIANYEQVFGRPPVLDAIQDVQPMHSKSPSNVIVALEKALQNNRRLKASTLQIEKAKQSVSLEQAAFFPTLDFVVSNTRDRNVNQAARREETSALLKMNWTLFSGKETVNRVAAAKKDLDEQQARQLIASNKVGEAVRINWNQLVNGAERLELLDSAASISKDVMDDRKRLRDAGKESALSVLDAEVEYYGVLANKVNAAYDTRISSFRLLQSIGDLSAQDLGIGETFQIPVQPLRVDLAQISAPAARK